MKFQNGLLPYSYLTDWNGCMKPNMNSAHSHTVTLEFNDELFKNVCERGTFID